MSKKIVATNQQPDFLVMFWSRIFKLLSYISIFSLVRRTLKLFNVTPSYNFVDFWVLGNFSFAIALSLLAYSSSSAAVLWFVVIYESVRVFEIVVYQINVVLFDPFVDGKVDTSYRIKSVQRMLIALFMNYFEIMFAFAALSIALLQLQGAPIVSTWGSFVSNNIITVITSSPIVSPELEAVGYSFVASIINFEIIIGFVMTLIAIGRFIGMLPAVNAVDQGV